MKKHEIDIPRIEKAVNEILIAVGEDVNREGLKETPNRVARMYTELLSGMNEETHIKENIRIASEAFPESLTKKELGLVNRAEKTFRKLMKAGCTGCRYCMPCPAGVDIPTCFELWPKKM